MSAVDRRSLLLAFGAAALPLPVFAADPWTKEPSQWTEKDIERIMQDSPWAKNASVPIGIPSGGPGGGGRGGRGRGGGGMTDAAAGSGGAAGGAGGNMGGGPPGSNQSGDMGPGGIPSINFLIRWQSATPVKAALVHARMGKEADTSPQAKAFIEKEEATYVVAMMLPPMQGMGGGMPGGPGGGDRKGPPGGGPEAEARLVEATTLSWKAHEGIHPVKIIMPKENSPAIVFHFAKTHPIELEDKEVEFITRRGSMEIRKKFKLKDMIYNGKLAL